jgi:hypothetical protein
VKAMEDCIHLGKTVKQGKVGGIESPIRWQAEEVRDRERRRRMDADCRIGGNDLIGCIQGGR